MEFDTRVRWTCDWRSQLRSQPLLCRVRQWTNCLATFASVVKQFWYQLGSKQTHVRCTGLVLQLRQLDDGHWIGDQRHPMVNMARKALCNTWPPSVRDFKSLTTFRCDLKTHCFQSAFINPYRPSRNCALILSRNWRHVNYFLPCRNGLVARTSIFGWRTFHNLRPIYGGHVTTSWIKCPRWINQPSQLSLPSLRGR